MLYIFLFHLDFLFYVTSSDIVWCLLILRYQQEGINWLAFLRRFNLHGILCDDMGLGKTLQSSAIVASDIAEHLSTNKDEDLPPSLIICPSTLVGHWVYEIEKFIDPSLLTTLQYIGSAQDRSSLRLQFNKHNTIVTSYDVVRKDIDHLSQLFWNYCILDEGHIIKNSKSKVTCAVKQLKAKHRLILSGTPIQVFFLINSLTYCCKHKLVFVSDRRTIFLVAEQCVRLVVSLRLSYARVSWNRKTSMQRSPDF